MSRARGAGVDTGRPVAASRTTAAGQRLAWRLAAPRPLGLGGVQPFLISWGDGAHPADALGPSLELVELELRHPDPGTATRALRALDVDVPVAPGPAPLLRATLAGPEGLVVL